jgi:hypothetical protein
MTQVSDVAPWPLVLKTVLHMNLIHGDRALHLVRVLLRATLTATWDLGLSEELVPTFDNGI